MPRHPIHLLTLALLALVVIAPTHAKALSQGDSPHSIAERFQAASGLFSQLWRLVSVLWSENGSALEPDGANADPGPAPGTDPSAATGDNGSALEPDGR